MAEHPEDRIRTRSASALFPVLPPVVYGSPQPMPGCPGLPQQGFHTGGQPACRFHVRQRALCGGPPDGTIPASLSTPGRPAAALCAGISRHLHSDGNQPFWETGEALAGLAARRLRGTSGCSAFSYQCGVPRAWGPTCPIPHGMRWSLPTCHNQSLRLIHGLRRLRARIMFVAGVLRCPP